MWRRRKPLNQAVPADPPARDTTRKRPAFLDDEIFLQPWFIPREIYSEIRRLLPNIHLSKMRYYFEDYGCLKCGERKALYGSNGLCEACGVLIRGRVARCLQRRLKKVGVLTSDTLAAKVGDEVMSARQLLRSLTRRRSIRRNTDAANAD